MGGVSSPGAILLLPVAGGKVFWVCLPVALLNQPLQFMKYTRAGWCPDEAALITLPWPRPGTCNPPPPPIHASKPFPGTLLRLPPPGSWMPDFVALIFFIICNPLITAPPQLPTWALQSPQGCPGRIPFPWCHILFRSHFLFQSHFLKNKLGQTSQQGIIKTLKCRTVNWLFKYLFSWVIIIRFCLLLFCEVTKLI